MSRKIIPFQARQQLSRVKQRLQVSGFELQDKVSIDQLKASINLIPDTHLEHLQVIKYDPTRSIQKLRAYYNGGFSGMPAGEYLSNYQSVVIYDFVDYDQFRHILFHEIGHYVFFKVISSFTKKDWVTQIYPNSLHVSDYAKRNACEDFAESYAFYLNRPETLKNIPSKFYFMQNKVFSGLNS